MSTPTIHLALDGEVARLTVSHPGKLNALNMAMLEDLDRHLALIEARGDVRAVVLTGEGERFFSAGADIRAWSALTPDAMARQWIRTGNRVMTRLASLDAVVICLLQGDALGGGLELALSADLRIAVESAHVGLPEAIVGAVPAWLGCARLQALVGPGRARQMILTGERIDARRAEAWGIVNEVVAADRLEARGEELVALVRSRSSVSIRVAKQVLDAGAEIEPQISLHEFAAAVCLAGPDAEEGAAAFKEKRAPVFKGHPFDGRDR